MLTSGFSWRGSVSAMAWQGGSERRCLSGPRSPALIGMAAPVDFRSAAPQPHPQKNCSCFHRSCATTSRPLTPEANASFLEHNALADDTGLNHHSRRVCRSDRAKTQPAAFACRAR